jgi:Family of unknown function (DUF6941)
MEVPVAVLCDAATDYHGKLNLLGVFDALMGREFPLVHPSCAVAVRFTFEPWEEGTHRVKLTLADEDGKEVIPALELSAMTKFPPGFNRPFISQNMILGLQRMKFERPGRYAFNLFVDGEHRATIPLVVVQHPSAPGSGADSGGGGLGEGGGEWKPPTDMGFEPPRSGEG